MQCHNNLDLGLDPALGPGHSPALGLRPALGLGPALVLGLALLPFSFFFLHTGLLRVRRALRSARASLASIILRRACRRSNRLVRSLFTT